MDFLEELSQQRLFKVAVYCLIAFIAMKIVDQIFCARKKKKGAENIQSSFLRGVFRFLIIVLLVLNVASLWNGMHKFANTILMSSSLLVVVLGFIFQEGLSNIIHGFIITVFKPFDVGDRIEMTVGGNRISGYVLSMNLRHTIVKNIMDKSESIIPNSVMDSTVVKNLTTQHEENRYPLTVAITYEDAQDPEKLAAAKKLLSETILENRRTIDLRKNTAEELFINVTLEDSSVNLTCFVETQTAEDNYYAGSEIRQVLLAKYRDAGINFAYPHMELVGKVHTTT